MIFLICCWILGTLKIHFWVANLILQAIRLASACFQTVRLNLTYRIPYYTALLYFLFISNHGIFLKQIIYEFIYPFIFFGCAQSSLLQGLPLVATSEDSSSWRCVGFLSRGLLLRSTASRWAVFRLQ